MRLSETEIKTINEIIHKIDNDAKVYLFGSRTNDKLKGGDIDLLIISSKITFKDKLKIKYKLFEKLGEQKIDVIVTDNLKEPFFKMIRSNGILLNE